MPSKTNAKIGNPIAAFGWALYGLGGKATSTVVFLVGPLMLTNTARIEEEHMLDDDTVEDPGLFHMPHVLPTSVPSVAIAFALLLQCIAAPLLALVADRYGLRRVLMTGHVALGLVCNLLLGISAKWSVVVRAALIAGLYYAMALAWMFQNALLPSVASSAWRPMLSLSSAGLSNLGAGLFLLVQYRVLVGAGHGEAAAPSEASLDYICLLAAAIWFATAAPAILCLATLRAEQLAPPAPPDDDQDAGDAAAGGGGSHPPPPQPAPPVPTLPIAGSSYPPAAGAPSAADAVAEANGGVPVVRVGISGVFAAIRRLRRHKHAARFVLAQTLYLTAATTDGTTASLFAQEVVGLPVARIVRLAIYAAVAGALGSAVTAVLARAIGARPTLCGLMSLPPLLLLYTSLVLATEEEFFIIGLLRAFIAGGVGFHGLNRGVFSQVRHPASSSRISPHLPSSPLISASTASTTASFRRWCRSATRRSSSASTSSPSRLPRGRGRS